MCTRARPESSRERSSGSLVAGTLPFDMRGSMSVLACTTVPVIAELATNSPASSSNATTVSGPVR
ncbi:hypothetical protein ACFPRL_26745 [Pseudoclavibacter helvolus]